MTHFEHTPLPARTDDVMRGPRSASTTALVARFRREEDGSIILFSLFLFVLMILIGGMAVDLMRFETRRVHVQNTLDSAMLAAADLDQDLDPEDVVRDYFATAGYDPNGVTVAVDETRLGGVDLVGRSISASTRVNVPTIFMHMLDVPLLSSPVSSAATENIQNVEISLVLDISGSMRWTETNNVQPSTLDGRNRINELRKAVRGFAKSVLQVSCETDSNGVETCTQPDSTSSTTINIIPYAGHVNPGPEMFTILGGNRWHSWSSCKEVTNADFGNGDLPRNSGNQLPHFMNWTPGTGGWVNWGWCPKDDASILYASNDYQEIVDFITNIKLHDGTATHVGMKYGVALLNPSSRDEFGLLADAGVIEDEYRNRPADFDEEDVVKYIVLMTDGATTGQHRIEVMNEASEYDKVYNPANGSYATLINRYGSTRTDGTPNPASTVETGLVNNGSNNNMIYYDGSVRHDEGRNNGNIDRMCNWAKEPVLDTDGSVLKEDRITVFTISFFTTGAALTRMENCASRPSFHFPVQNLNIETAFQAIAKTINQLRLTL
jgi:Flp pilus assembly protein TadG